MKDNEAQASFNQLKKDLSSGELRRFYLLFGRERYLRNYYEKKLLTALGGARDDMNTTIFDSPPYPQSAVIDASQTLPFFAERRIIVVRYSGYFKMPVGSELADFLDKAPETTTFIFIEDRVDAKLKLYKRIAKMGLCVEFIEQPESFLLQNIGVQLKSAGKRISQSDAEYFISVVGRDMGTLRSELDKVISYAADKDVVTSEDIKAICTIKLEDRIFDMIGAVMDKNLKRCMDRYEELLALREPAGKIIIMLERQFLWMLQLKSMVVENGMSEWEAKNTISSKQEVDTETGEIKKVKGEISSYQAGIYLEQAKAMSLEELQRAVDMCAAMDEGFKSGRISERAGAELLLIRLCSGK